MFGLPMEAISMIASTVLGGLMKVWGQAQQDKADQFKMMIAERKQSEEMIQNARQNTDPFAAWTRRIIALSMVFGGFAVVFAPAILDVYTNVPIEKTEGFKFLFLDFTNTVTEYISLKGVVAFDWVSVGVLSVVSFYLGASAVSRR